MPNLQPAKRILITGGAGFLGSHLCDRLMVEGHHLVVLDDMSTGSIENIRHLLGHPRFELLRQDVAIPFDLPVDQIYNLASPASPLAYQRDPVGTVRTIVLGVMNVLELARRTGATMLQASTSEVYGDPEVHPQPEAYRGLVNPIGPRACYDEGKRCAETLCADYRRQYGVRIRIARIFNTYGPRMQSDDGRVIPNFITQALDHAPITMFGDGETSRSFCYVDDLIGGLIALMNMPGDEMGPVNIGNDTETTMLALAQRIIALTGSRSALIHSAPPEDDPRRRRPDIARAREWLDWWPRVGLDAGLQHCIAYFADRDRDAGSFSSVA